MTDISKNIMRVREQIGSAARLYHRDASSIQLIAVSKTKPAAMIQQAHACGLTHIGESYLQESLQKIASLKDLDLCWHFIGPIQSNKTRKIAENFDWVHSVDSLKVARRLSSQRPSALESLNVCVQVNISGEASKSGVSAADLGALVEQVLLLPRLRLRGLMSIPSPSEGINSQREPFRRLRELLAQTQAEFGTSTHDLQHLSMGMSADLQAAIAEGATLIRIGTGIFGRRDAAAEHR
jgi:hypothetical protein|tara:strand:- start:5776 stop:6489 length:714 start_codon:yes stop_codon:yes gene_type:complete